MNPRCSGCSIESCSERFSETDRETGTSWAKVYHKMLANPSIRRSIREDGHGDIGWLLTALILEAKRIEHSHGVLCDHGSKMKAADMSDSCALPVAVVETNLRRLIDCGTVIEIDGTYILSGFDRLQYSRTTLWRRSNSVSVNVSVKHRLKQDADADAEENTTPPTPSPEGKGKKARKADGLPSTVADRLKQSNVDKAKIVLLYNRHIDTRAKALGIEPRGKATDVPSAKSGTKTFVGLVLDRLAEGFTFDDLDLALAGMASDDWCQKTRKMDWEWCLRNREQVEKYLPAKQKSIYRTFKPGEIIL